MAFDLVSTVIDVKVEEMNLQVNIGWIRSSDIHANVIICPVSVSHCRRSLLRLVNASNEVSPV